jgi:hypothetical protein
MPVIVDGRRNLTNARVVLFLNPVMNYCFLGMILEWCEYC